MNFEAWIPIFLIVIVFSIALLVHLATHDVPFMPKWAWALLIVFTMPLGGLVYVLVVIIGAGTKVEDAEGREPQS